MTAVIGPGVASPFVGGFQLPPRLVVQQDKPQAASPGTTSTSESKMNPSPETQELAKSIMVNVSEDAVSLKSAIQPEKVEGMGGKATSAGRAGSKKGQPWTEAEHLAFISGLKKLGKGNWRGISRYYVQTRTPTQVASHAQKHFMRLNGVTKRKSRFSLLEQVAMSQGLIADAPRVQPQQMVAMSMAPVQIASAPQQLAPTQWMSFPPHAMALPPGVAPGFMGAMPLYQAVFPGGAMAFLPTPITMVDARGAVLAGSLPAMSSMSPATAALPAQRAPQPTPTPAQPRAARSQANPAVIKFTRMCRPTPQHAAGITGDMPKIRETLDHSSSSTRNEGLRQSEGSAFSELKSS